MAEFLDDSMIAEINRRIIQGALEAAPSGSSVNTDELPLLRDLRGRTPVAVLFTIPKSAATEWTEANSHGHKPGK